MPWSEKSLVLEGVNGTPDQWKDKLNEEQPKTLLAFYEGKPALAICNFAQDVLLKLLKIKIGRMIHCNMAELVKLTAEVSMTWIVRRQKHFNVGRGVKTI